ncbi:MAG: 4-alpha-glucanotransferase [Mariprofundales bacterium]|nr:4-alpha-glucanotransferase [Mariprofundales bacterium]
MDQRRSGLLLHITSLPGPLPNGVLGEEAIALMDGMAASGTKVWQFLPIGPTHGHGSPYESLSTFAGNPDLIDLRSYVAAGWLTERVLAAVIAGTCSLKAARESMVAAFGTALGAALEEGQGDGKLAVEWQAFVADTAFWLEDYALFFAIRQTHDGLPWWQWEKMLRDHDGAALAVFSDSNGALLMQAKMEQFLFARQWQQLKEAACARGIVLLGDLPIYVSHDSADVWAHRPLFTVNAAGMCDEVAGVPPDYFSETGQRWGNPLYHWNRMAEDDFSWWVERVRCQHARVDWLRIDHFRGLESYWAIPGDRQDGRIGEWRPAPGAALLDALQRHLGELPLVAEDLGMITEQVHALRKEFALPGMKILQFAFGGDAANPYLPHNHSRDMVAYTGTHDNDTTVGWWQGLDANTRDHVADYLGIERGDGNAATQAATALMRQTLASVANIAVLPVQDLLLLDGASRLNTPGTVDGNWSWRLSVDQFEDMPWLQLKEWNRLYGRD